MGAVKVIEVEGWTKPLPAVDNVSRPYWSAAARGELMVQECARCGVRQFYGRQMCTACAGTPTWIATGGRGTIHTFTVIRQYGLRPFTDELPYVVGMIKLPEGPMMLGGVTDCPVSEVHIGMAVEVYFLKVEEELAIPYWRPLARGSEATS